MIDSEVLRWILTGAFAATGGYCLVRCVRPVVAGWISTSVGRVSYLAHLMMSVAMIAMAWPLGTRLPLGPQVAVFALAALWFVVLAASRSRVPAFVRRADNAGRLHNLHEAVIMAAMVWMVATMPTVMAAASGRVSDAVLMVVTAVSAALVGYFGLMALWWIARIVRGNAAATATHHGVMSVGMGVMLLAVL